MILDQDLFYFSVIFTPIHSLTPADVSWHFVPLLHLESFGKRWWSGCGSRRREPRRTGKVMRDWKNLTESWLGLQVATNIVAWKHQVLLEDREAERNKSVGPQPCLDHGTHRESPGTNSVIVGVMQAGFLLKALSLVQLRLFWMIADNTAKKEKNLLFCLLSHFPQYEALLSRHRERMEDARWCLLSGKQWANPDRLCSAPGFRVQHNTARRDSHVWTR